MSVITADVMSSSHCKCEIRRALRITSHFHRHCRRSNFGRSARVGLSSMVHDYSDKLNPWGFAMLQDIKGPVSRSLLFLSGTPFLLLEHHNLVRRGCVYEHSRRDGAPLTQKSSSPGNIVLTAALPTPKSFSVVTHRNPH